MKLNTKNLKQFDSHIICPSYNRDKVKHGIVHIGVGGFHRAHLAYYTDRLLAKGESSQWGICGAGLRPEDKAMKAALETQDYLYSIYELSEKENRSTRVIGSISDLILASDDIDRLIAKLTSPDIKIVSLTITEGGYYTDDSTGEFINDHPQIQHDLQNPSKPKTVFGLLTLALANRREMGIAPFTVLSCDNLPHNGQVARNALLRFAERTDVSLSKWIARNVSFPNSMVDRITPMTSETHRQQLLEQRGIEDVCPVVCEPFIQWVLEDSFCNGRPEWESVGVQFTKDVTPYEDMKIRLLNGSHLAMTYLGFSNGYRFVHQTMQDPLILEYVRAFMDKDVSPLLSDAPGVDFSLYKNQLIERFSNPIICDQLSRTCSDGSSKFPKFVLPTLLDLISQGQPLHRVSLIIASWANYLSGVDESGDIYSIPDPRAKELQKIITQSSNAGKDFLGLYDIFGDVIPKNNHFVNIFNEQLLSLRQIGVHKTIEKTLAL
ncbi:MAG: mannitol dehydrogenase family protein [Arenicella sp.]